MKFLFYSAYKMVYIRTILFYMHVVELNQIMQVTVADMQHTGMCAQFLAGLLYCFATLLFGVFP